MSYALAVEPGRFVRLLSVESYASEGGRDLIAIEGKVRDLQNTYQTSAAITDRQLIVDEAFQILANDWRNATRLQSSLTKMTEHPAYREIIQLGEDVVPILLRELKRRPEPWFTALREITRVDPVSPEQRGDWQAMANAWLQWGRDRRIAR
jgi:hypothetical protein